MSGTQTQTLIDTRPETSHGGGSSEVFHYVDKSKIVESAVTGTMVTALCGKVFSVTKAPKPGSAVCPECTEFLEMLKSFDSGPADE